MTVNFIQNIRYKNNPMMDRPSFDQYGGSISIGRIKLTFLQFKPPEVVDSMKVYIFYS